MKKKMKEKILLDFFFIKDVYIRKNNFLQRNILYNTNHG